MTGVRGVHIGDGAYLDFDGIYWWLSTERQEGTNLVALDCTVMFSLVGRVVRDMPELAGSLRAAIERAEAAS